MQLPPERGHEINFSSCTRLVREVSERLADPGGFTGVCYYTRARAHVLAHLCRRDADENFYCGTFSLSFAEIRAEDARTFGDLEVEVEGPRLRVALAKKEIRFSKERKYYFLFLYRIATIVNCNADLFVSLS